MVDHWLEKQYITCYDFTTESRKVRMIIKFKIVISERKPRMI